MTVPTLKQDVYDFVIDSITNNNDLKSYIYNAFSKNYKLILGYHEEQAPENSDYPVVIINKIEQGSVYGRNDYIRFLIAISTIIESESITETTNNGIVIKKHNGLLIIERISELIVNSLIIVHSKYIIESSFENDLSNLYPIFRNDLLINFYLYQPQRGGARIK